MTNKSTIFHEYDTSDFRDNVLEVLGDKDNARARFCYFTQGFPEYVECMEVKAIGGFIQDECLWLMNKGLGNKKPTRLS